MFPARRPFVAAALSAFAFASLAACSPKTDELVVSDAVYRPPLGAAQVGVLYMTVTSPADDAIVTLSSPDAERLELHETVVDNGVASMVKRDALELPAGKPVSLSPGGAHVMVFSPRPIVADAHFSVTIGLRSGSTHTVEAVVSAGG